MPILDVLLNVIGLFRSGSIHAAFHAFLKCGGPNMGLLSISRAEYDPRTRQLSFCARALHGTFPVTITSSIRLERSPRSQGDVRWAIVRRSRELLAA
jgi:hypothetical protein